MLNISNVNFTKISNNFLAKKNLMMKGLSNDVFVRNSAPVSFKGVYVPESSNPFMKWAEETDFINSQLRNILTTPEHQLGSGFTNTAYEIPGNDDYILRISTSSLSNMNWPELENASIEDTDLQLDVNVGQCIAEISVPSTYARPGERDIFATKIEVLKKQQGESIGVQPPETLVADEWGTPKVGVEPYEAMSRKEKFARTIHKVAQLPVESYEKLLTDYKKACSAGYRLDHLNSNNLLIDEENKSINLIDMERVNPDGTVPHYANLLYSLTNCAYFDTYTYDYPNPVSDEDKNKALQDSVQIITKFMQAMQNTGSKFDRTRNSYEFAMKYIPSYPNRFYCQSFSDEAFWKKAEAMGLL